MNYFYIASVDDTNVIRYVRETRIEMNEYYIKGEQLDIMNTSFAVVGLLRNMMQN